MLKRAHIVLGIIFGCYLFFASAWCSRQVYAQGKTLKITSPINGEVFSPGDRVTVKAVYSGDPSQIQGVHFFTQDMHSYFQKNTPYEYEFIIDKQFIGRMIIAADVIGLVSGSIADDSVEITVRPKEPPIKIEASPPGPYYFHGLGDEIILHVEGVYPAGTARDITHSDTGTFYSSSDTSVFGVSEEGRHVFLRPSGTGRAKLVITNGITKTIDVYVEPK